MAKPPQPTVDEQLAVLDDLPDDRNAQMETLKAALAARHCRVAARAARLAEDALLYDLVPA